MPKDVIAKKVTTTNAQDLGKLIEQHTGWGIPNAVGRHIPADLPIIVRTTEGLFAAETVTMEIDGIIGPMIVAQIGEKIRDRKDVRP